MKNLNLMECIDKYSELGWVTLPVKRNAKMPYIKGWQKMTPMENAVLKERFHTTDNIGILTGKVSGIIVIDVDVKRVDGMATLAQLETEHGKLPRTVKAVTPSGGIHLYYRYPQHLLLENKAPIGQGIDVQADGSQCVVYPSVVFDKAYEWEISPFDNEIADLPATWINLLSSKKDITVAGKRFKIPAVIADGNRNVEMTKIAGHIIGKKVLGKDDALEELDKYNQKLCEPPLDDDEILTIFESIWNKQREEDERNLDEKIEGIIERTGRPVATSVDDIKLWYTMDENGRMKFLDAEFCEWLVREKQLFQFDGLIYNAQNERIEDLRIKTWIADIVRDIFINNRLNKTVNDLTSLVKCFIPENTSEQNPHEVHFLNKAFDVSTGQLVEVEKTFTVNIIPHDYDPDAKCPTWDKYIEELLEPENARTLQQYIGYCLTPSTRAQVALFVCGKGGEGKSRIKAVLQTIFGKNLYSGKLNTLSEARFGLAPLQHKLVAIEDDMDMGAFTQTAKLKELITSDTMMEFEEKSKPLRNVKLYSRIIALGNGFPQAIYDNSDGWNRRIHPIITKPMPADRIPDANFIDKLNQEIPGIIAWAVRGLLDFMQNGQRIYMSESTVAIKQSLIDTNGDTFSAFLDSGYVEFTNDPEDFIYRKDLARVYRNFCSENECQTNKNIDKRLVQYRQLQGHEPQLANTLRKRVGDDKKVANVFIGIKLHE